MAGCNDSKYNCGDIIASSCVPYTGKDLTFLDEGVILSCDANINDVFFYVDEAIKILKDNSDLTDLDLDCLVLPEDTEVTLFSVHQAEILQICENKANIAALTTQFNEWSIQTEVINITLPDCLTEDAAPCAVGENQYQLGSLLILILNKLCDHESRILNLE